MCTTPRASAALHQTIAIQDGVDGAFGRDRNPGEAAQQAFADFASSPTGVLALHVQDVVLDLKGKLVGIAIGTSAAIGQAVNAAFLITIKDLIAGLARDPELTAQLGHWLASQPPRHKLQSLIHDRTLLPRHPLPPRKGKKCNPCVRYVLLPMCRVGHPLSINDLCRVRGLQFFGSFRYIRYN